VAESISRKELATLENPANNEPLLNRAIAGPLPDGSTFKVITATAALESGKWSLGDTYDDTGQYCFSGGLCLHNAGGNSYGTLGLQEAIQVSDDVFFYNLGDRMNGPMSRNDLQAIDYPKAWPLQDWAARFGIGRLTGVDLPGELPGEIGSPKLLRELWKQERECDTATGLYKGRRKHPAVLNQYGNGILSGGCGIASAETWSIGDNVNTGVGQFDDLVTPIQLGVAYAAIENGGTIVTPHLGAEIESPSGTPLQTLDPAPKRKLDINTSYLSAIQEGLRLAASASGGTSADVMGNFPEPVYGKTGTAEIGDSATSPEHAWYVCYVPASATNKPILVVVNVEKGGFGDVAAAPVARQLLSQWFLGRPGPFKSGTSSDR
jgi:penicillin-binding protein 2